MKKLETNKTYRLRSGMKFGYDSEGNLYHLYVGTKLKFLRYEERPFVSLEFDRKEEKFHTFPVFSCNLFDEELMVPFVKMMWYPDFKNYPDYKLDNSVDLMFEPV